MEGYRGSLIFAPLADKFGLPVDMVNFLVTQLVGLTVGVAFRSRLRPGRVSTTTRHVLSAAVGVTLLYLCFNRDTIHVINQTALTYIIMRLVPAHSVHRVCLVVAMLYLSWIHYWRLWIIRTHMDISGPVMVLTMKTTLLACNIHDGSLAGRETVKDKPHLRDIALSGPPSLLEYVSYTFSFQNLLVGPLVDFRHYRHYMEHGTSPSDDPHKVGSDGNANVIEPSAGGQWPPVKAVVRPLLTAAAGSACVLLLVPLVPHSKFRDEEYHTWSLVHQWVYMYVAGFAARMKYYTAWSLSQAVCTVSGLGFNGRSIDGSARWDGAANVDIWRVEFGGSFRDSLLGWNLGTARWLRLVVYERTSKYRTAAVYVLSALWHGLNPCYYLAFSIGGLCTQADRVGKRHLWPHCRNSTLARWLYCACAFLGARASLAYFHVAFELLNLPASLRVYGDTYFLLHFVCLAMMFLLPRLLPVQRPHTTPPPTNSHPSADKPTHERVANTVVSPTKEGRAILPEKMTSRVTEGHVMSDVTSRRRQWMSDFPREKLAGSVLAGDGGGTLGEHGAKFHVL